VYVPERVRRVAEEEAARALRLALHRRAVLAAVCATWPADPGRRSEAEWQALRAALPAGTSAAQIRNRTRQVRAHLAEHQQLPADVTEVEGAPVVAAQVLLAAADKQLLTLTRAAPAEATASGGPEAAAGELGAAAGGGCGGPQATVVRVRLPEWRTVPAPTAVGQRPAGHEPQSGHSTRVVRSGRARDVQHRTGFHRARATPVLHLSADYGPRTGTTAPARNV
jgi:hypothetical protein